MKKVIIVILLSLLLLTSCNGLLTTDNLPITNAAKTEPAAYTEQSPTSLPSLTVQPSITPSIPDMTQLPEATSCADIPLVAIDNSGALFIGMEKDLLQTVLGEYGLNYTLDEYGNVDVQSMYGESSIHLWISFDENGKSQYIIVSGIQLTPGLSIGSTYDQMLAELGDNYIDIAEEENAAIYAYGMDGYTLLVNSTNKDAQTITGWCITNMPDYSWDMLQYLFR